MKLCILPYNPDDMLIPRSSIGALLLAVASIASAQEPAFVILKKDLRYVVQADGRFATTTELLVRINEASALAANRQQEISFNARDEKIRLVDAYLEHASGKRQHVAQSALRISRATVLEDDAQFRDRRLLRIPFKGLRAGDTFYYKVIATQARQTSLSSAFFASWTAPDGVQQYSVTVDRPSDMRLYTQARGFQPAAPVTAAGRTVTRWDYVEGDYSRMEVGSANRSAFRDMLVVSTYASYAELARDYNRQEQRQAQGNAQLDALARGLVAGLPDQRSKALAIHSWVQRHIRYRAIYFGDGSWLPARSATAVLQSRWGDCKEHALLMEAMLAAVGIDSTSALISWGDDLFTLPDVAMLHFNHVINYLPALDLYLDATSKDVEGGYLPADQLDKATLLTRSGITGRTPAHQQAQVIKQLEVHVQVDGSAQFAYDVLNRGQLAETRRSYTRDHAADAASGIWLKNTLATHGWHGTAQEHYDNVQARSGDFHYTYTHGAITDFLQAQSIPASSALWQDIRNTVLVTVADATRTQPFRCAPLDLSETATYTFPDTLTITTVPADLTIHDDYFDYSAHYTRTDHGVKIERKLRSRQTGSLLCTPADYASVAADIGAMHQDVESDILLQTAGVKDPAPTSH
jgi:transglutaminase-like putative cysteine protease